MFLFQISQHDMAAGSDAAGNSLSNLAGPNQHDDFFGIDIHKMTSCI